MEDGGWGMGYGIWKMGDGNMWVIVGQLWRWNDYVERQSLLCDFEGGKVGEDKRRNIKYK